MHSNRPVHIPQVECVSLTWFCDPPCPNKLRKDGLSPGLDEALFIHGLIHGCMYQLLLVCGGTGQSIQLWVSLLVSQASCLHCQFLQFMVGSNREGQKLIPMLDQDKLREWNNNGTKKTHYAYFLFVFCFLNQKVPKTRYLRETEGSPSPLQCWLSHCMSVLSWLYHCHVCRNRWLDTEQRVPKPTKKIKWKVNFENLSQTF